MFWRISNIRRRGIRSSTASTTSSSIMTPHCGNKKRSSTDANKKNKAKKWGKTTFTVAAVSVCGASLLALMQMRFMWNYLLFEEETKTHISSHGSQRSPSLRATIADQVDVDPRRKYHHDKVCSALRNMSFLEETKSMSTLWIDRILPILMASKHPDDPHYSHKEWTKSLLAELTPSVLQQEKLYDDSNADAIQRVLDIIFLRIENPLKNPPLKIAVLGGSITEGNGCEIASVHLPKNSMMGNPTYCAWPYRLEAFVNNFIGSNIIKVVNMAEEGTSTTVKTPLLKYWMYPTELLPEGPDVILHAYEARDALPFEHENESLVDALQRERRTLVESVQFARPCGHPPLVLHLSDVTLPILPQRKKKKISSASVFLSLDYSKAVQKVSILEEQRMQKQQQQQQAPREQDIPFGMAGHLAVVWTIIYNIADALLFHHCRQQDSTVSSDFNSHINRIIDVNTNGTTNMEDDFKCQDSPCILAWLSGPTGTAPRAQQINIQLAPYVKENTGWRAETDMTTGWSRKAGLVAVEKNAKIVLEHRALPVSIRMVHIMAVKSYSPKFLNSVARFDVTVIGTDEHSSLNTTEHTGNLPQWSSSFEMHGTHTSMTHITFPFVLDMKENAAQIGETLRVEITLISGSTFKILGMMFCSR